MSVKYIFLGFIVMAFSLSVLGRNNEIKTSSSIHESFLKDAVSKEYKTNIPNPYSDRPSPAHIQSFSETAYIEEQGFLSHSVSTLFEENINNSLHSFQLISTERPINTASVFVDYPGYNEQYNTREGVEYDALFYQALISNQPIMMESSSSEITDSESRSSLEDIYLNPYKKK